MVDPLQFRFSPLRIDFNKNRIPKNRFKIPILRAKESIFSRIESESNIPTLESKNSMRYTFSSVVRSLISTYVFVTLQRLEWNYNTNTQVYDHQLEKSYLDGGGGKEVFSFSNFPWETLYKLVAKCMFIYEIHAKYIFICI